MSATCSSTETANRLAVRLAAEVSENDTTDIVGKNGDITFFCTQKRRIWQDL